MKIRTLAAIAFFGTVLSATAAFAAAPAQVEMKSLSYSPKTVEVVSGQAVIWKNTSLTQHSATSYDDGKTFDTGMVAPGKSSKEVVFSQPGEIQYHCSMHGKTMSGKIVIKPATQSP